MATATEILADIATFEALRRKVGTNGMAEYQIDDGQGRQTVKYISLAEINSTIRQLQADLLDTSSDGGPVFVTMDRGPM